ncbi:MULTISPECIES: hypothetical protein [unclassified Streptomyces]|uniref:hypothetical protein n=1 Tax=unclassified Streptomyces TaxID=2593676 RepID=UPI00093B0D5B|nr:hypothetical protein [Streptomyces sp. TSRI0107]OKJ74685.1 hypothetical protein AMK31_31500 [Streptomyces sp. TSRI0107]
MRDDSSAAPASAARRLASWLRDRGRPVPPADAQPDDQSTTAEPPAPPPTRLRPQPEDDASVYPLF